MEIRNLSERAEQARTELGHTSITAPAAAALVALFVLLISAPPLVELWVDLRAADRRSALAAATVELGRGARAALGDLGRGRPGAANARLARAVTETETLLEDDSLLRRLLLPPVQRLLTARLGLGNEQAYVGREGWLFFRPDFDYSVGPGFLNADELERRRRETGSVSAAEPDPVPALTDFADQLAERRIRLLVLPVPAKTVIHPWPLVPAGRPARPPVHNPSFDVLVERLRSAGIAVYDPTADLLELSASGAAVFLRGDSHWTPRAVEVVAAGVARRITPWTASGDPGPLAKQWARTPLAVSGRGDLVAMLRLADPDSLFSPETIEIRRVEDADGHIWRPRRPAPVLLLGDSFANVFSDPVLGWGSGAGLAEQLAFELDQPVDRIARNAGGAFETREELARELAAGRERLSRTRVVVYQFAVRELASGDWRIVRLPSAAAGPGP